MAMVISLLFSSTKWGKKLEITTMSDRFAFRDHRKPASNIILILEDHKSQEIFKTGPTPREIIALFINALDKMNVSVIGIDFRFEEPKSEPGDSLLCQAMKKTRNVITGCFFKPVYDNESNGTNQTRFSKLDINIDQYNHFPYSPDSIRVFHRLLNTGVKIRHINIQLDSFDARIRTLPLYIMTDSLQTAFSLEIVKSFFKISNREIKIKHGKIVLMPAGADHIRIPVNQSGEYLINYLGPGDVFGNYHSWAEFYDLCHRVLSDTCSKTSYPEFENKIVLIGSLVDEDLHPSPFTMDFPGVLIHATVIDNILAQRFLTECSIGAEILIIILMATLLLLLFLLVKPILQLLGALLLLFLYGCLSFLLFKYAHIILPLTFISVFILLAISIQSYLGYIHTLTKNARLEGRNEQLLSDLRIIAAKSGDNLSLTSFYRLFIFSICEPEQCIFPHLLETREEGKPQFTPFTTKPIANVLLKVKTNKIAKLSHNIKLIVERYSHYIITGKPDILKPIDSLRKIGNEISESFGLKFTFKKIFNSCDNNLPLNLVVTDLNVPWHWAYSPTNRHFICEDFAIGFSFAMEKSVHEGKSMSIQTTTTVKVENRMAVLFYGNWQNHPVNHLKHVQEQIFTIEKQIYQYGCPTRVIRENCQDFLNTLVKTSADGDNLRIIHYSGHAKDNFLNIGPNNFIKSGMISETLGLTFPSRPLVFLNACSSGRLPEKWDKLDNLSTEFLACGAGACIVTSFDVYELTACRFAQIFYDYYVSQKKMAGEALKLTIQDLGRPDKKHNYDPDYDITRYFYQLFGDPTLKF